MIHPACYHCRRAEALSAPGTPYKWPDGTTVKWYLAQSTVPPSLSVTDVEHAVAAAAFAWASNCGVIFDRAATPADAQILVYFGPIDGAWGILGETELPTEGSALAHHRMELDPAEQWTPDFIAGVVLHEMGHGIGIGHAPEGVPAVMQPIYQPGLPLQPWDAGQGVERYGPPPPARVETLGAPVLTLSFTAPSAGTFRIQFDGDHGHALSMEITLDRPGPNSVTFRPTSAQRIA